MSSQITDGPCSKTTFSYTSYASSRPTYSALLYNTVLNFCNAHHAGSGNAVGSLLDLGCGPGTVARELAPHFATVTAVDPSEGMVARARQLTTDPKISVRQAGVEDVSFLADSSVDLAVAGTAAHWFDYKRAWPELARVVKSGGSLAFWGYKMSIIVGYPHANPITRHYAFGKGEVKPGLEGLGRFWEEPGRSILMNSFADIIPPQTEWEDVTRIVWEPDDSPTGGTEKAVPEALWLRKRMKLGQYEAYARTWSSYNNWRAVYPDKKSKVEGGQGDVVDAMFGEIVDAVPEWKAMGEGWREVEVECVWGTCLLMARRRK